MLLTGRHCLGLKALVDAIKVSKAAGVVGHGLSLGDSSRRLRVSWLCSICILTELK
jgi:hypothetical protein